MFLFVFVSDLSGDLHEVLSRVQTSLWLGTGAQRCPLVRAAYLRVVDSLRKRSCENFLSQLCNTLTNDLNSPLQGLQVGALQPRKHVKFTHEGSVF